MLRFLLDEHISPTVAHQLRGRTPPIDAQPLRDWHSGDYLGMTDEVVLRSALDKGLTLVTYDVRTIPPLLKSWAEQGLGHAGIVFVDRRTIASNDIGALVSALTKLHQQEQDATWTNRLVFLTRHDS